MEVEFFIPMHVVQKISAFHQLVRTDGGGIGCGCGQLRLVVAEFFVLKTTTSCKLWRVAAVSGVCGGIAGGKLSFVLGGAFLGPSS